ncbi:hypothetical protein ASA1KI_28960 [Opitutales bacterium ASA1]|uniref:hypothetical protein n=1 Tax=Congregicoccus parvus TaxID=3081749 RepID=UPI002B2B395F|nr:hypothetical protein ASA1KI_28960 [Opitutales bacterium ASA1]
MNASRSHRILHRLSAPLRTIALVALLAVPARTAAADDLPAPFFPPTEHAPSSEEGWSALEERFPHLVRPWCEPAEKSQETIPATPVELRPGLVYLRIRSIDADLASIAALPTTGAAVLDLRFLGTRELEPARRLGAALARAPLRLALRSEQGHEQLTIEPVSTGARPRLVIALVNRATAGPFEAVLYALQQNGDVLLVGEPTRGATGLFARLTVHPRWQIVRTDVRPSQERSLLGTGAMPALHVEVDPADDEESYRALDAGTAVGALLDSVVEKTRFDEARLLSQHDQGITRSSRTVSPPRPREAVSPPPSEATPTVPVDRILQRAVNAVVALQALGRLGDS